MFQFKMVSVVYFTDQNQDGVCCVFYRPESIFKGPFIIFDPKVILTSNLLRYLVWTRQTLKKKNCHVTGVYFTDMLLSQEQKKLLT